MFVTFHDAGWAVRRDGKSQTRFILAVVERSILKWTRSPTSLMLVVSKKCPRVTRSSLGRKVQSENMTDEETTSLRLANQEMMNGDIQLRNTKEALAANAACLVTECKGLYDSLVTNVSAGLGADDRRNGIEAPCQTQSMATSLCTMRWLQCQQMV